MGGREGKGWSGEEREGGRVKGETGRKGEVGRKGEAGREGEWNFYGGIRERERERKGGREGGKTKLSWRCNREKGKKGGCNFYGRTGERERERDSVYPSLIVFLSILLTSFIALFYIL